MGAFGMPEIYAEQKMAHHVALANSKPTILQGWDELAKLTGRKYSPVETYKAEGAETLISEWVPFVRLRLLRWIVCANRAKRSVCKPELWRPLPTDELRKILAPAKDVVILDRSVSLGGASAPVTSEIRALMYHNPKGRRFIAR